MKYLAALLLFTLFSCKSVEFAEMKKQLVTPGQPSGVITFRYSSTLNVTKSTLIKSISVSSIAEEIPAFVLTDLETGTLLKQDQVLEEGKYFIEFSTAWSEELEESVDTVFFNCVINGKEKTVSKKTSLDSAVNMK